MTLVRRAAQLISDLKLLNMIKEQDTIYCTFIRGVIHLKVYFDSWGLSTQKSIREAIEAEFEDLYIKEEYSHNNFIGFYICKDEITNEKLHEIYLETH